MTSSSPQQTQPQHLVQLAVYDLSHGMARQLSAQFLGGPQYAIDIIPHTGIVVFGREYFWGGGIQQEDPQHFRQMMGISPVQMLTLGHTHVSRSQFDAWCHNCTTTGRYTMASYDLLTRNCNNFSRDAAVEGLRLPSHVFPQWILEIPGKFLSSPMGQMIRPMLENMQVTGPGPASASAAGRGGNGAAMAPFANAPTTSSAASSTSTPSAAAAAAAINNNPWTNIPAKTEEIPPPISTTTPSDSRATPVLDSFCKPLISTDSKTISLCVKKMIEVLGGAQEEDCIDDKKQILENTCQSLSTSTKSTLTSDQVQETCHIIMRDFLQNTNNKSKASSILIFVLMFLRVLILQSTGNEPAALDCLTWIQTQLVNSSNAATTTSAGGDDGNEKPAITQSSVLSHNHSARAMAWLILSNATSLKWWWHSFLTATNAAAVAEDDDDDDSLSSPLLSSLTEAALMDLSSILQPRVEVRQAASGFCYNMILNQSIIMTAVDSNSNSNSNPHSSSNELSDDHVSLLCASLEGIDTEPDATTRLRRLLVAARILVPVQSNTSAQQQQQGKTTIRLAAKLLMNDLGFVEALQELLLVSSENNNHNHSDKTRNGTGSSTNADAEKCQKVTKDLLGLLQD